MINPNVIAKNSYKGVVISWDDLYDGEGLAYAIVRNPLDYPQHMNDGILIYQGTDNSFVDETVENGKSYFYSLYYVENDALVTNINCNFCISMAFVENGYAERFYRRFPSFWRRYDALIDTENEELNKPFFRMCRVIGYEFDKLETLLGSFYDNIDIDNCNSNVLPILMGFLGVEYDWKLTITENRMLAKIMRSAYSRKGCVSSLRLVLMNLLKSDVSIELHKERVRRDADISEIRKKRTISIVANNFESNFVWIEEDYNKFLEVIREFVPKKFTVKLVIINNFFDEFVKTNMSDTYKVYRDDLCTFVDVPRERNFSDSSTITDIDFSSETNDEYTKQPTETIAMRYVEGRRRIEVYSANPQDYYGNDDVSVQVVFSDNANINPTDDFVDKDYRTSDTDAVPKASDNHTDTYNSNNSDEYSKEIEELSSPLPLDETTTETE